MKLYCLCAVVCILFNVVSCAYKAPAKTKEILLDEKVSQLIELSSKRSVIRFDGKKFHNYVKATPRNYSTVVMFTALQSHRQCGACRDANSEFEVLADSWRFSEKFKGSLFFAMVDYDDGPDVFNSLHINTAPIFIHFPAKGRQKSADSMPLERMGFSADAIAKFVMDRTNIKIVVNRPPNYTLAAVVMILSGITITLLYWKRNSLKVFYNKAAWATGIIAFIFTMTSGQMWNHIRGAQFVHKNQQNGEVVYVHPWSDSQLVVETYIVFALNAAVVMGIILLNEASGIKSAVGKRRVKVYDAW
jgi:hypothetical protein